MYLHDTKVPVTPDGVLLLYPSFSAGVHQMTVTTLFCLPTGPFSLRQKENKYPKGEPAELLNYGDHPSFHPPIHYCAFSHRDSHLEGEEKYNLKTGCVFSTPEVFFWREVKTI